MGKWISVLQKRLYWYSERHSKEEMNLGKLICLYTLNLTLAKVKFYDWTIILFSFLTSILGKISPSKGATYFSFFEELSFIDFFRLSCVSHTLRKGSINSFIVKHNGHAVSLRILLCFPLKLLRQQTCHGSFD